MADFSPPILSADNIGRFLSIMRHPLNNDSQQAMGGQKGMGLAMRATYV